jgi:hypothetical protein
MMDCIPQGDSHFTAPPDEVRIKKSFDYFFHTNQVIKRMTIKARKTMTP